MLFYKIYANVGNSFFFAFNTIVFPPSCLLLLAFLTTTNNRVSTNAFVCLCLYAIIMLFPQVSSKKKTETKKQRKLVVCVEYSYVCMFVFMCVSDLKEGYTCGCVGGGGKQKYTIVRKGGCWFTETCTFAFWLALGVPARPGSPRRKHS